MATKVSPIVGLYTAAAAGIIASIFAGSRYSVSGPAAAMVPILAVIVLDPELGIYLPIIGVLAGIFLTLFGVFKLGNFIKFVHLSVTLGFTAGIAVTLFFTQRNNFLGITGLEKHEHFHENVIATIEHLSLLSPATLIVGFISLLILIYWPKIKGVSKIPASLIAVLTGSFMVYLFPDLFKEVQTIKEAFGSIPKGLPPPVEFIDIPELGEIINLIVPSLKVAFLISVESLLCAVVADKMTKTRHKSNKELIAQGISNIATPFLVVSPLLQLLLVLGHLLKMGLKLELQLLFMAF